VFRSQEKYLYSFASLESQDVLCTVQPHSMHSTHYYRKDGMILPFRVLLFSSFAMSFTVTRCIRFSHSGSRVVRLFSSKLYKQKVPRRVKGENDACDRMIDTFQNEIIATLPLRGQKRIPLLIGVSGGRDSVCLLHMLVNALTVDHEQSGNDCQNGTWMSLCDFPDMKFSLHAIHFDHKQRGEESSQDRRFVESLCSRLNVPLKTVAWNESSSFSQGSAREWRRKQTTQHMMSTLRSLECTVGLCLTAHHKDDSEETLLLKLLRGVHLTNLSGMSALLAESAFCSGDEEVYWARPLLGLRKAEITRYMIDHHHAWREDLTNHSKKYLRNRVRNELIPLLQDILSEAALEHRISDLERQSVEMRDDINHRAGAYLEEHTELLDGGRVSFVLNPEQRPNLVQRHAIYKWLVNECCSTCSYKQLNRLLDQINDFPDRMSWTLDMGQNWSVRRLGHRLYAWLDDQEESKQVEKRLNVSPAGQRTCGKNEIEIFSHAEVADGAYYVLSTVGSQSGLRFYPPWRHGWVKIGDFLRGQGVPAHKRGSCRVITLQPANEVVSVELSREQGDKEWVLDKRFKTGTSKYLSLDDDG